MTCAKEPSFRRRYRTLAIFRSSLRGNTPGTRLALPTFDGGAKARVRRRVAPAKMMLLRFPLEQYQHAARVVLAAQDQPAPAAG